MIKSGTVIKTENGKALLLIIRDSACGDNCAGCGICSREKTLWVKNDADLKKGDSVEILLEKRNFLLMCIMAYLLPLAILLLLFALFYNVTDNRETADLFCVFSVIATFFVMMKINIGKKYKFSVRKKTEKGL